MTLKRNPIVIVSSKTGNTMIPAHAIADAYTTGVLFTPETAPKDLTPFNPVLLGFWCDRGDAPENIKAVAARLSHKTIGFFATMGGNAADPKSQAWMEKTCESLLALGTGNNRGATFLCRGRIDPALFDMMTKMAGGLTPERQARRKESETHPDRLDCLAAVNAMAPLFD